MVGGRYVNPAHVVSIHARPGDMSADYYVEVALVVGRIVLPGGDTREDADRLAEKVAEAIDAGLEAASIRI